MSRVDLILPAEEKVVEELAAEMRKGLSQFVGEKMAPQTLDQIKAVLVGNVHRMIDAGLIEVFKPEITVELGFDGTAHITVREKLPARVTLMAKVKPSTPPDLDWESRMTPWEARWCLQQIEARVKEFDEPCSDNYRAAQIWKSTQRRRFRKIEALGCCGSTNWVEKRWSVSKGRWDYYLLGFNYGH